jgi:hypothetical protein
MEMTLDQIGLMLVEASKRMPKERRASFEDLMRLARTPVGGLGRRRKN